MTDATDRRRPLIWEGSSKQDFKEFPTEVQKDFAVALFVVQIGETPASAKQCARAPRVPEEIEVWNQHAARGHRADPETIENSVGTD